MVWLANFFVSLTASVLAFFGQTFAKKTLIATAAIAAFLSLTGVFVLTIKALLTGIVYALPPWAASVAGVILPTNFGPCISAYIAAKVARWIYEFHTKTIQYVLFS